MALLTNEPAGPLGPAVERLLDDARAAHLRKLRGFYIEYADGAVLQPTAITAAEAQELINDVQTTLDVAVRGWCHNTVLDRLQEAQEYANEFIIVMDNALQAVQTDPDTAVVFARWLIHEGLHEAADPQSPGPDSGQPPGASAT